MKALAIAAIVLVVIGAAGVIAFVFGVPAGLLVKPVSDRLEARTGYRLGVAGDAWLTFRPTLTFAAHDVSLASTAGAEPRERLATRGLQISLVWASLLSGRPEVSDVMITQPVVRVPLLRERVGLPVGRAPTRSVSDAGAAGRKLKIDRIAVRDGTIVFASGHDSVESTIEHVDLTALLGGPDHAIEAQAQWDGHPVKLTVKAFANVDGIDGQSIPVEFAFDAPGLLQPLSGAANMRMKGATLGINGLAGSIGEDRFAGWASVDFASKPFVKTDVDFRRLDLITATAPASAAPNGVNGRAEDQTISSKEHAFHLSGLNFVDADVRLSAAELKVDGLHMAPISVQATLQHGVLQASVSSSGLYGGQVEASFGLDASGQTPRGTGHAALTDVRAQPLLSDVADFHALDGRMRATMDAQAAGTSRSALLSSLAGSVELTIQDGQIRGINVARMVRDLANMTLSGWQENPAEQTDFAVLDARFRIADGRATTEDLRLASPLIRVSGSGSADLINQTLQFRLDPKVVMSLEGQGGANDPAGLGVPVIVEGSWSGPHIYPDIAGILQDPDTAYGKLRALGQGLRGKGEGGAAVNSILQGLGSFLNSRKPDRGDEEPDRRPSGSQDARDQAREILQNLFGR
jgi:AsmA protein